MRPRLAPALLYSLTACGGGGGATSFGGVSQSDAPASSETSTGDPSSTSDPAPDSTTTTSSSTTATASSSTSASTDDTVWDMGMPDFAVQPAGCQGKIDFLFVIASGSFMLSQQEKLVAAFPGFMAAIEAEFPGFDVHVLSANTDTIIDITDCGYCTDSCDPQGDPPYCGAKFSLCDKQRGAGVTFPTGEAASNRRCALDSGRRYITTPQHDLDDAFMCIARIGGEGGDLTAMAMQAALSPAFNDPRDEDACNGGFLRDDALLVVTIINEGYDDSPGTVDEWIEDLRDAKNGDDDAFAVLVLTTDVDLGYGQLCLPNDYTPVKNPLRALAEGVEHGFIDSICIDSFVPFFAEHVGELAELCDAFAPPG